MKPALKVTGLLLALSITAGGCVMADQSGQALPDAVYQSGHKPLGELSFHFRTTMNYLSLLARLAFFAGALWLLRWAWQAPRRQLPIIGAFVVASVAAGWLLASGASKVAFYEIAVDEDTLRIHIPFEADIEEPWHKVLGVSVEGKEWRDGFEKLYSEWSEMEVLLSDGRKVEVDLEELGVVQRSIFMKALLHRSKMQSIELSPRI